MNLVEVFNPIYIITGFAMIGFFHISGLAFNHLFKIKSLPSYFAGMLFNMLMFGVVFIYTNVRPEWNYQIPFLIYIFVVANFSLFYIVHNKIKFGIKKEYFLIIALAFSLTLINPLIGGKTTLDHDFWLYGHLMNSASNFIGNKMDKIAYMYSNFYNFLGAFIGMFNGGLGQATDNTHNYALQTPLTMAHLTTWITTIYWIFKSKNKKVWVSFLVAVVLAGRLGNPNSLYGQSIIGSHMLVFLGIYVSAQFLFEKWDDKSVALMLVGLVFFTSSTIFFVPAIVFIAVVREKKQSVWLYPVYIIPLMFYIFEPKITYLLIAIGTFSLLILRKQVNFIFASLSRKAFKRANILRVLIAISTLIFILLSHDYSKINTYMGLSTRIVVWAVTMAVYMLIPSTKLVVKYGLFILLFVSPLIAIVSNIDGQLTSGTNAQSVVHRIGHFALIGEAYSFEILMLTLPLLIHFIFTSRDITKRNSENWTLGGELWND